MRNLFVVLLLAAALFTAGCARGMVTASAIKPAVDIVVTEYVELKAATSDPIKADKIKLAEELKATIDLAAGGGE